MIALIAVFLAIALILCFVAVIIYSPLVSGGNNTRIQQLEGKVEQPLRVITRIAGVTTSTSPVEIGL